MGRRNQAPANREPATLGTKIDDGCSFGTSRWEAPPQLSKLVHSVLQPSDDGDLVGRPDVFPRLKIRCRLGPSDGNAGLAERCEVVAVGDVVAEVVAHAGSAA